MVFLLAQIEEKDVMIPNEQDQEGQDGTKSCGSSTLNEQHNGEAHVGSGDSYSYNEAINLFQMDLFPGPHSNAYLAERKNEIASRCNHFAHIPKHKHISLLSNII